MNYLEELQKITEDYQKAKLVILSCSYSTQLESAIAYSTQLVRYHCTRLGIPKKYDNKLWWFFFEREKKQKNKIIQYIDLCVNDLQDIVEDKRPEMQEFYDSATIGYGDPDIIASHRVYQEMKKWEEKKEKENIDYEYRKFGHEKLQVD